MATKKTTSQKTKAKAKAKAKPKTTAKPKAAAKPKARSNTANIKMLTTPQRPTTRRPPNNPAMPDDMIESTAERFNEVKAKLEEYAAESIFSELARFFKSRGNMPTDTPTKKQQLRDAKALINNKHAQLSAA